MDLYKPPASDNANSEFEVDLANAMSYNVGPQSPVLGVHVNPLSFEIKTLASAALHELAATLPFTIGSNAMLQKALFTGPTDCQETPEFVVRFSPVLPSLGKRVAAISVVAAVG